MNSRRANQPTHRPTHRLNSETSLPAQTPHNRQRHFAPYGGRAGRLRQQLSERDLAILGSLRQLRLMTGQQVRRLYFPGVNAITQSRKTRAALKRLAELQLIVRLKRRIGGLHAGSEGHVIGLSGLGHSVLNVGQEIKHRHRRVIETKPAHQDHLLAVAELCLQLTERVQTLAGYELLEFAAEPGCWRRFSGIGGHIIPLKPDAFVRLVVDDFEVVTFIEMDMATESLTTIVRKLGVYVDYWHSGQEQHDRGVFPAVWWLVPDPGRLKVIARGIQRVSPRAQELFKVVLIEEAVDLLTQLPEMGGLR